jgi:hypothetical protein
LLVAVHRRRREVEEVKRVENSNSNNKDKYRRPGVIEDQSSIKNSVENERDRVGLDGPYRGAQSPRGLGRSQPSGSDEDGGDGINSHRLTITRAAEEALVAAVERINDGFQGGKVNRNQVAIWALVRFGAHLAEDEIREIRAEYLDEFSAMDALLRRAKDTGKLPPELRAYLQKQMGFEDAPKKKAKKSLQENIINDDIKESA